MWREACQVQHDKEVQQRSSTEESCAEKESHPSPSIFLVRHRPIQGESNIDFLGESEGSLPQPQDSFLDAGEAMNDFVVHVRELHIPPSR